MTLVSVILSVFIGAASAYEAKTDMPTFSDQQLPQLEGVGVSEDLGRKLDLNRTFVNEAGETVPLSTYFDGKRPVLLTMVYYGCESLCNYHLNGLLETFKKLDSPVGKDFQFVAVSMNHREGPELAKNKKATYLQELNQPGAETGWHFLTGTEENVGALAKELGFKFKWIEAEGQYSHPAVAYVATPEGMISRYLYGIEFSPKTLRLSLVEAADGKIGNLIEQAILFCFQFNPAKNKYTLYAYNIMQVGAVLTVILLGIFLVPIWLRERKKNTLAG